MLRRYVVILLMLGLALGVSVVGLKPREAAAAPVGAANGQFVASQSCQGNGLVSVRFIWGPSGWGPQWVDVSLSPTFNGWANAGPIGAGQNFIDFGNLLPNTTYFSRIATYAGVFLISDPIAFVTGNCAGSFSPPHNLRDDNLNNGAVRFRWDPGVNNFWYCLDVAESVQDLVNLVNSWRNFACGTTSTTGRRIRLTLRQGDLLARLGGRARHHGVQQHRESQRPKLQLQRADQPAVPGAVRLVGPFPLGSRPKQRLVLRRHGDQHV